MVKTPPLTALRWRPAYRIISTRFPAINLFDRVASPEDFEALYQLESMTNPRIREEIGEISTVPGEFRKYGPGFGPVMAAFAHRNPSGSRFSNGSFGVFYAASRTETAIAETRFHQSKFLAATREPPVDVQMKLQTMNIQGKFHDIRSWPMADPVYCLTAYGAANDLASRLRDAGSEGLVYNSVRDPGGECIGAFHPGPVSACNHAAYFLYRWDGLVISDVLRKVA